MYRHDIFTALKQKCLLHLVHFYINVCNNKTKLLSPHNICFTLKKTNNWELSFSEAQQMNDQYLLKVLQKIKGSLEIPVGKLFSSAILHMLLVYLRKKNCIQCIYFLSKLSFINSSQGFQTFKHIVLRIFIIISTQLWAIICNI